jgi:hypothetical protein
MRKFVIVMALLVMSLAVASQDVKKDDPWKRLSFLEGQWEGTGNGMSGKSEVTITFEFMLKRQFLKTQSRSVFEPQEKNPDGEIHEDFGIFSYDRFRKSFVLRAFYVEGFVNTYVLTETSEDGNTLTFETESVENDPPGTKAKLVYKRISETEMEEKFFVAFPGKEYGCFVTNVLKKK